MRFNSLLNAGLFILSYLGAAQFASAATPSAFINNATITATNNSLQVSRLPIQDGNGKITYYEVLLNFKVSSTGVLSLDPPLRTLSPVLTTGGFKAGQYKDTNGNKYTLSGPSVIAGTTRTSWVLSLNSGSTQAKQFSSSWVTGPIAGHPNQSSITARSITTTAYSWGTVGKNLAISGSFPFYYWATSYVVGAAQVGNQLVLHLFAGADNTEDDNIALQLCATAC